MKSFLRWRWLILGALVILALLLRLYGLNWDEGNNFHPDERQILFVVMGLAWPKSWVSFLDPVHSPLNPHFFAYGSFPIYLLALIGHLAGFNMANTGTLPALTLVGRVVSVLFDCGTVLLTGCTALVLARRTKSLAAHAWSVAYLATLLATFVPLDIQLAHFYTVDTLLTFFVILTLFACVKSIDSDHSLGWFALAGLAYGLALATKFSAAPLAVPLLVAACLHWHRKRDLWQVAAALSLAAILLILAFFVTQPYALLDFSQYVQQVAEQGSLARGSLDLPYVRQFVGTVPYLYQIQNMVLWGLGLILGCTALLALIWLVWQFVRTIRSVGLDAWGAWPVLLSWVLVYGAICGSFYVKFMRYMLPIYPVLIVLAAVGLFSCVQCIQWSGSGRLARAMWLIPFLRTALLVIVIGGTAFQGLALLNVYSQPNTRVQASLWIYQHIPAGSVLTYEQWDDALPVAVGSHTPAEYVQATYTDSSGQAVTGLDLYDDDTLQKASQLAQMLSKVNVITMPTDRLDKSIPRSPQRYPMTIRYYQLLYSGKLGFRLEAQFVVRPHLFGITLDDSNADESYSVFDHPHARIFVCVHRYSAQQLQQMLTQGLSLPS